MLQVRADFEMSDPDLLALVDAGQASYVLRVLAPRTHFRCAIVSDKIKIEETFQGGQIHGPAVFSPFLVSTSRLRSYSAKGWHADYASLGFDVEPGSVLAEDEPKEYWVDTAEEAPIGSIFTLRRSDDSPLSDGIWRCHLLEEKVVLEMSTADYKRFLEARARVNGTADASYIMNAVYLPALIWVLEEADRGEEQYRSFRWFRVLDARLGETHCAGLGGRIPDFPEQCVGKRWTVRLGEVEPVFGQTGRVVLDITARTAHDGALKWTRAPSTPRAARSIFATFPSTCALPSGGRWSLRRVLQRPGRQRKRSSAKSSCGPSRTSSSAPSSPPCCNARCAPPRLATRRAPSCATCPGGCGATAWRPSTFAPPGARRCRSRRRTTARNTPVGRSGGRDSTP